MKDAPATWPHSLLHQLRSGLWRLRLCFLSCYLSKTERQQHRQPQLSANTQGSPQGQSPPLPEPGDESLLLFPITSGTVALLCTHTQTCLWKPPRLSDFCHHFSRGTQMHTAWWEKKKKQPRIHTKLHFHLSDTWITHTVYESSAGIEALIYKCHTWSARGNRWGRPTTEHPWSLELSLSLVQKRAEDGD